MVLLANMFHSSKNCFLRVLKERVGYFNVNPFNSKNYFLKSFPSFSCVFCDLN